jgi:hypothetical protein
VQFCALVFGTRTTRENRREIRIKANGEINRCVFLIELGQVRGRYHISTLLSTIMGLVFLIFFAAGIVLLKKPDYFGGAA